MADAKCFLRTQRRNSAPEEEDILELMITTIDTLKEIIPNPETFNYFLFAGYDDRALEAKESDRGIFEAGDFNQDPSL